MSIRKQDFNRFIAQAYLDNKKDMNWAVHHLGELPFFGFVLKVKHGGGDVGRES